LFQYDHQLRQFKQRKSITTGHSILIDEISLDERARYFPWANKIGGLCREHANKADLQIRSMAAVDKVADLLEDDICHMGRKATVAAIASFRTKDYHAKPVLISPTCKSEKAPEQAEWIKLLIERWRPFESTHGPLWSVATDGDTTRRAARDSTFNMGRMMLPWMVTRNTYLKVSDFLCKHFVT